MSETEWGRGAGQSVTVRRRLAMGSAMMDDSWNFEGPRAEREALGLETGDLGGPRPQ